MRREQLPPQRYHEVSLRISGGYHGALPSGTIPVCMTCFTAVPRDFWDEHDAWHRKMEDDGK